MYKINNIMALSRQLLLLALLSFVFSSQAQLVIKDNYYNYEAKNLVQKYFANSGIRIDSVYFIGKSNVALGSFTGGNTAKLGINEGIVLSTGKVLDIPGDPADTISTNNDRPGFSPLSTLLPSGTPLGDEIDLVIKFTTLNDTLKFRYILASEEFPPFSGDSVKDVFGFFISGEAYTNKNLATFPGTSIDIKIDSFANPPYNQYYISNNPPGDTTAICFNGFTKVMTAVCPVVPCKQYTLKIALGDARDKYFDSGLFLEAGSFSSTRKSVVVKGSNGDNGMVEKCGTATFIFQRDYITSSPEILNFFIEGTAINGTDYTDTVGNMIPTTITFPAYKKQVEIKVKAVDNDDPNEPTETIIFKIPGMTLCNDTVKAVLYLKNTKPMSVIAGNDTTLCSEKGETANLVATVSGGVEPYKYYWLEELETDTTGKIGDMVYVAKPTYDPKNEKPFFLYRVVVVDSCETVITSNDVKVTIKCPIKTTNVITPNGDGYNDKFIVKHLIEYPNTKLVVLNRWGNKVFETNNYQNDWGADKLADGVYFFIIELPDGSKFQGSITVLR